VVFLTVLILWYYKKKINPHCSLTFFMNMKALKWKGIFSLPFLFSLPPEADVVVAVFTLGLLFSDSSSSLVNEASASHNSSPTGFVSTVEQQKHGNSSISDHGMWFFLLF